MKFQNNKINKINPEEEFSSFLTRNHFSITAKTEFDTKHFAFGSPVLESSNEPIDKLALPNSTSKLVLLSTENNIKFNSNKKMNESYNVSTRFKTFLRPSTEQQLLKSSSMINFDSKQVIYDFPNKKQDQNQHHCKLKEAKTSNTMNSLAKRNHMLAQRKSINRFYEFKEKNRKMWNYTKYSTKTHFTLGYEEVPMNSTTKDFHSLKAVQK